MAARNLRVGVDIGGTFTDLSIVDGEGIVALGKQLTTHQEPAAAVAQILEDVLAEEELDPGDVSAVIHGTTLVTNALIERRGAKTALITTSGFRDVIEMGREHRYELYDLNLELPRPLVPRHLRIPVAERILADGTMDTPLDTEQVKRAAKELVKCGVEAVAVCCLHSHVNAENELAAKEAIQDAAPELRVALSSEINPEIREYERFSTTLANVYVQAVVEDYLADLRNRLATIGISVDPLIMLSHGGLTTVEIAQSFPIRMLESGPAGGALGAVSFGRAFEEANLMAFDMGGTTAKLCTIEDYRPLVTHTFEVGRIYRLRPGSGLPVRAPVIDMIEIGAGGGSIARVDSLGLVTIGPDSAGSEPGPVSYGRGGTRCTVTDADLVLGYLDPASFLGGTMTLDREAATTAIEEQLAKPMGVSVAEAAWGIHATVNDNMANAARVHAIERGQDPSNLPLFVSGGNGPLHGPGVARSLGSPSVIAPPAAGVLSTLGFLAAPISIDVVRSSYTRLEELSLEAAQQTFQSLEADGMELLRSTGLNAEEISHARTLDMRFVGQGSEIEVDSPELGPNWHRRLGEAFTAEYRSRFGDVVPTSVEIEILTWRVRSSGPLPNTTLQLHGAAEQSSSPKGSRAAYFAEAGAYVDTPVYERYGLTPGAMVTGPALIEEKESTLVLPPNSTCRVGDDLSIFIEFQGADQP